MQRRRIWVLLICNLVSTSLQLAVDAYLSLGVGGKTRECDSMFFDDNGGLFEQSLRLLSPRTGRKHQLRVHCAQELGAPIVGDDKYGGHPADRLYLHARRIRFPDPFTAGRWIDVSCLL
ncbi:hypothetical protein PRIC1_004377 [Phytophthora ramorum]